MMLLPPISAAVSLPTSEYAGEKAFELPDYRVVLAVPEKSVLTSSVPVERLRLLKPVVSSVWDLAFSGKYEEAMLLNGLSYSAALGYDSKIIIDCLAAGAKVCLNKRQGPCGCGSCREEQGKGCCLCHEVIWQHLRVRPGQEKG